MRTVCGSRACWVLLLALPFMTGCYTQVAALPADVAPRESVTLPDGMAGVWYWVALETSERVINPEHADRFTLTLGEPQHRAMVVDCNKGWAQSITVSGDSITIGPFGGTKIGCESPALGRDFLAALAGVNRYRLRPDTLYLELSSGGHMTFVQHWHYRKPRIIVN